MQQQKIKTASRSDEQVTDVQINRKEEHQDLIDDIDDMLDEVDKLLEGVEELQEETQELCPATGKPCDCGMVRAAYVYGGPKL